MHLGGLSHDLVEGRKDESIELDLAHRAIAAERHPQRGADNARFRKRRIDHPMLAKVLLQSLCDPEDAAKLAHVLASDHDLGIGLQGPSQTRIERLCDGHCGHQ
jgi:hypothetical protein